jgi:hypothetical protein
MDKPSSERKQSKSVVAKLKSIFANKHRGIIWSFFMFVFGWVAGMKISSIVGAYLIMIAVSGFLYWLLSEEAVKSRTTRFVECIFKDFKQAYRVLAIIVIISSLLIIRLPLWSPLTSFLAPEAGNNTVVTVIYDLTKENQYVIQTPDPVYKSGNRIYKYALLVEFGVRRIESKIDIELNIDNEYQNVPEYYFGMPLMSDGSMTPEVASGHYTVGFGGSLMQDASPPVYKATGQNMLIYPNSSLYIYFESNKPIEVKIAIFNGKTFYLENGQLVPQE